MAYSGFFKPRNPKKYKGDPSNIIYRSRWELVLMRYLDNHPDIISWNSECIIIPYISPVDNKIHRYFPDFKVKKKNSDGSIETWIIEIKPAKQCSPPIKPKKVTKNFIKETVTYAVNKAKWKAAEEFCLDRKYKFMIFTEKELGIKF